MAPAAESIGSAAIVGSTHIVRPTDCANEAMTGGSASRGKGRHSSSMRRGNGGSSGRGVAASRNAFQPAGGRGGVVMLMPCASRPLPAPTSAIAHRQGIRHPPIAAHPPPSIGPRIPTAPASAENARLASARENAKCRSTMPGNPRGHPTAAVGHRRRSMMCWRRCSCRRCLPAAGGEAL